MRLGFVMVPTSDLEASVDAYATLGLSPIWRPDDETVVLGTNGRAVIMIEDHPAERALGIGPVMVVDSFPADTSRWEIEPTEVPGGTYGAVVEEGHAMRFLRLNSKTSIFEAS